jgi:hypothetical protein
MISMVTDSIRKEVYHPRGKDRLGRTRLVRAAFDFVLLRDTDATTDQYAWYCQPSDGSPDLDPNVLAATTEPASCRVMVPYVSDDKMVMDEALFGNPTDDTLQACHFFGQV